jgi:UDP-glucose 4-epimerase
MRVLITGASGFIGRNVVHGVPTGWQVLATYNRSRDFVEFLAANGLRHVEPLAVDLAQDRAGERIAAESPEFDAGLFLAANGDPARSVQDPALDLAANTATLIEVLRRVRVRRFVYLSSGAVYDGLRGIVTPQSVVRPSLPYAISKLASEHYLGHFVRQGRVETGVNVRFFGAFGPHEPDRKIFTRLVRQFSQERDPRFSVRGDGRNMIDAMYVDDAVRALLLVLEEPDSTATSMTLDLSGGRQLTIAELVRSAAGVFGLEPQITYSGAVAEYIEFRSGDRTMAERYGFAPRVSLEEGLRRLAAHLGGRGDP